VDHLPEVRVVQRLRDLRDDPHRLGLGQTAGVLDPLAEVDPLDEFEDEVTRRAVGVDLDRADDVRVFELRGRAEFLREPVVEHRVFRECGLHHLDGHLVAGLPVAGAEHRPHPAAADGIPEHVAC
jgi:hypothetical protein